MRDLSACSLLGDYAAPLGVLQRLAASKPWAKAMTQLPAWLPATSQVRRSTGGLGVGVSLGRMQGVWWGAGRELAEQLRRER